MLHSKKYIITVISLILILSLSLSSCSAGLSRERVEGSVTAFNTSEKRSMKNRAGDKLASSHTSELYIDKETGNVRFYDKASKKSWNSLPSFENSVAASLYVKVFDGKNIVLLDSSANCTVGSVKTETFSSGATVTYKLSSGDISVSVPVSYSLSGGFLQVSCEVSQCTLSEGVSLLSLSFLPFMGAVKYDKNDFSAERLFDWFLVPDGVGALCYTAAEDEEISEYIYSVYGKEYPLPAVHASVAAYGIKQGDTALSVTVAEGDEEAVIKLIRANADQSGINRIYTEFIITPVSSFEGSMNMGKAYDGEIRICYEALNSDAADYTGIASSVRQVLLSEGYINGYDSKTGYPFYAQLVLNTGCTEKENVSSFPQAENLLTLLKGKGVNDINLILEGMLSPTLRRNTGEQEISSSAGGEKQLRELLSYAEARQMKVFSQVQLFSSLTGSTKGIDGKKKTYTVNNPLFPYYGNNDTKMAYLDEKAIDKASLSVIESHKELSCGVYVSDSKGIYGDFSSGLSYGEIAEAQKTALSAVSTEMPVMTASADINKLAQADYINNFPLGTQYEESTGYIAVPFLPAIFHSDVVYAGEPCNFSQYPIFSLLKSVEYGAVPHFLWCFGEKSDKYYDITLNMAADFYLKAEKQLGDLASERITEHFMYESGVYCTGYENGARVYVNYNNYSVYIGQVAVMPYDFLRIG